jgi:hypothetical protein
VGSGQITSKMSEQYAEQLDGKVLHGHIIVLSVYEDDVAFGGIDLRRVAALGILAWSSDPVVV